MTFQSNHGDYPTGTFYPFVCPVSLFVSSGQNVVCTVVGDQSFSLGNQVCLRIPKEWGIQQLSGKKGYILSITDLGGGLTNITVNIDITQFDPMILPSPLPQFPYYFPQMIPIGDCNSGTSSPGGIPENPNTIPGAFDVTLIPS